MEIASKSVRMTVDDLRRLPDDGLRHELIDGEHYVSPAPRTKHQRISGRIFGQIFIYLKEHPLGEIYYAPLDVVFSEIDCVEPDLLYVSHERAARQTTEDYMEGAPDLVIEILSPSTKHVDRGVKYRLYDRFQVPEYWIVDPENEQVKVYRREEEGGLLLSAELSRREGTSVPRLSTPLLPGFELSLDEIFE
jgi:Uma2 family endonuclease